MKLFFFFTALCVFGLNSFSQLKPIVSHELDVQKKTNLPKITIDCKNPVIPVKVEYKPFIDFMQTESNNIGRLSLLNFHIKYTTVYMSSLAMSTNFDFPSLTADFIVETLDCITIAANNIEFTPIRGLKKELYKVSLNTAIGSLKLTNKRTNNTKSFNLQPLGFGIYSGSVVAGEGIEQVKETVVVVLTNLILSRN